MSLFAKVCLVFIFASTIFCTGCESDDKKNGKFDSEAPRVASGTEQLSGVDQVDFSALQWTYGGVQASSAALTSVTIGNLNVSGMNLSYQWAGDTLRVWGLSDGDAGALCCLFYQKADGTWVGGKFDWISTSRTTRDLTHCKNYNGWTLAHAPNPCQAAFVIVSSDGSKRSNVITATWQR